ncbi:MAG: hypothetical protein H0U04_01015 [Rubrobacter sp.]|nr:hypothetical protein [Rubrobacter sp.]
MTAELWQFGIMLAGFCGALILWLKIVYLPRRTMEHWESPEPKPDGTAPGTSGTAVESPKSPAPPKNR